MDGIDNCLIGPYFLPDYLNAERYEEFLREDLFNLLEDIIGGLIGGLYKIDKG